MATKKYVKMIKVVGLDGNVLLNEQHYVSTIDCGVMEASTPSGEYYFPLTSVQFWVLYDKIELRGKV
jgi:hypothetical protein